MLEIILLGFYVRSLSRTATAKGRSAGWAGLGVALWIALEVVGFMLGAEMDLGFGIYVLALVMASIGAMLGYLIVASLRPSAEYDGLVDGPSDGAACEQCHGVQTEAVADFLQCNTCGHVQAA